MEKPFWIEKNVPGNDLAINLRTGRVTCGPTTHTVVRFSSWFLYGIIIPALFSIPLLIGILLDLPIFW